MSKIICLGYFNRGNCGDEAFIEAHKWFFGEENIELKDGRMTAEDVAGCKVILGGGDVVAPFFLDWIPRGTPFWMVGVGLKYEDASAKWLLDRGEDYQYSWFRNHIDVDICGKYGIKSDYIPDIVFALKNHQAVRAPVLPPDVPPPAPGRERIIICLADHFNTRHGFEDKRLLAYLEWFKWELARALDMLADDHEIMFLPLSVYRNHMDHRIHSDVMARMRKGDRCLWREATTHPLDALSIFSAAHHVFSMKLHGNIFGLVTERACVNIGVGRKQRLLYEEAGLDDVSLPPYGFTAEGLMKAFATAKTPEAREKVAAYSQGQHDKLLAFRDKARELFLAPARPSRSRRRVSLLT
ncbi:polysaccharide pyruvyl transferase family protein [Muricoccus vinaceus]|uniref:Polysaccharide pyruvyl transferase family protein n=1 Tax=Muricoccus vinaceus TaxID=424704 RepID=A0ABV6J4B6_9PROT